ncbi:MAG: hypothetical protein MI757_12615 [Pirellulales bacterium]|nr:hypothetical protein [Pirellulales bacterium]
MSRLLEQFAIVNVVLGDLVSAGVALPRQTRGDDPLAIEFWERSFSRPRLVDTQHVGNLPRRHLEHRARAVLGERPQIGSDEFVGHRQTRPLHKNRRNHRIEHLSKRSRLANDG